MRVVKTYMFVELEENSNSRFEKEAHAILQPIAPGPYYNEDRTISDGEWSTVEEAERALDIYVARNPQTLVDVLVLLSVYRIVP